MKSNNERKQHIHNAMTDIERKERYKRFAYDSWVIFQKINPESESFKLYIDMIDTYLSTLHEDYGYAPAWVKDYHYRRMHYWNPLRIKVEREIKKIEFDTSMEFQRLKNKPKNDIIIFTNFDYSLN